MTIYIPCFYLQKIVRNTMTKKKRDKGKNNDLQNIAQKTKDWATQTPLKSGGELLKGSWRVTLGKGYEITMNTRENHIKYKD